MRVASPARGQHRSSSRPLLSTGQRSGLAVSRNASRDLQSVVSGVGPASVLSDGQSGSSMPAYAGGMGPDFVNDEDLRRHRFRAVTVARLAFFVSNFTVTFSLLVGSALDAYNQLEYNTTYMLLTPNLRHYAAMLAGMAAGSIVLGYCMDRFPVRRMAFVMCGLLFLGSCASFATAGLVLSTHPWFGMMRFVTGFGAGGMYPLAGVLSSASAEPHHRGKELVITFLMQLCGYAMAVVFTDLLLQFMCSATVEDGVDQPCTLAQLVLAYRVLMVVEALMAMFVAYMSNQLRAPRRSTPATEVVVDRRSRATNVCTRHMRELLGLVIPWVCVDAVVYGTSLLGGQELNGLEVYGSSYSIKGFAIKVRGHGSQRCAAPLDTNVNSAQNVALLILTSPGYFVALRFIESLGRRRLQLLGFGGLSTCFAVMGVVSAFLPASDQSWRHNQPWLYVCRSIVQCRGSHITLCMSQVPVATHHPPVLCQSGSQHHHVCDGDGNDGQVLARHDVRNCFRARQVWRCGRVVGLSPVGQSVHQRGCFVVVRHCRHPRSLRWHDHTVPHGRPEW